jgi:hypothetical protein
MSYGESPNPYSSPGASVYGPAATPIPKFSQLQYMQAFKYVMESPNWMMNLLFGALALLSQSVIPILGPLVYMGYTYEIIDHLHRKRTMPYPDFTFDRFSEYLARGVPPFVATLIFGLIVGMLGAVFYLVTVFGTIALAGAMAGAKVNGGIVAVVVVLAITFSVLLYLCIFLAMLAVTTPMSLRAGLSGNIGEAFKFDFIKDFIGRMWKDMLLAYLWLMLAGGVLGLAGALLCCIGAYPAWAWNTLAGAHVQWQLYELYLDRGGMQIPLKTPTPL